MTPPFRYWTQLEQTSDNRAIVVHVLPTRVALVDFSFLLEAVSVQCFFNELDGNYVWVPCGVFWRWGTAHLPYWTDQYKTHTQKCNWHVTMFTERDCRNRHTQPSESASHVTTAFWSLHGRRKNTGLRIVYFCIFLKPHEEKYDRKRNLVGVGRFSRNVPTQRKVVNKSYAKVTTKFGILEAEHSFDLFLRQNWEKA